jgi:Domain of unknown function (DUF4834)
MGEFLDFLVIAIITIYIIRSVIRLVLPMLFQSVVNKAQQGQQQNYRQTTNKATGSVKVDYIPKGKKHTVPDSEGEFVDYEEIK